MTNHKLPDGREILFVEVLQDASIFELDKEDSLLMCWPDHSDMADYYDLPQGNWSIIGVSDQMSEKEAKLLSVDFVCPNQWCENGYIDQGYNEKWRCNYCQDQEDSETPYIDSLASLLISLELDTNKRYVLLEKLKS